MKEKTIKSTLSASQRRTSGTLNEEREKIPMEIRTAFENAFAAWKTTWFRGGLAISSNPTTRTVGPEFDSLIALARVGTFS